MARRGQNEDNSFSDEGAPDSPRPGTSRRYEKSVVFEVVDDEARPSQENSTSHMMEQLLQMQQHMMRQQSQFMSAMTELLCNKTQVSANSPNISANLEGSCKIGPGVREGNSRVNPVATSPTVEAIPPPNPRQNSEEQAPSRCSSTGCCSNQKPSDEAWKHVTTLLAQRSLNNMAKPSFAGQLHENPHVFLERFETYAKSQHCATTDYLALAVDCLRNFAADWAGIYKVSWQTYGDFKNDFLLTFWSEEKQREVRQHLMNKRFNPSLRQGLAEYFVTGVSHAKYLDPPIPEQVLVGDLMNQLPANVRVFWAHSGGRTIKEALEFLQKHESLVEPRRVGSGPQKPVGVERGNTTNTQERPRPYNKERPAGIHYVRRTNSDRRENYNAVPPPNTGNTANQGSSAATNSNRTA